MYEDVCCLDQDDKVPGNSDVVDEENPSSLGDELSLNTDDVVSLIAGALLPVCTLDLSSKSSPSSSSSTT